MKTQTTPNDTLSQLMRAAQQGDGRAYGDLLTQITPMLKKFVGRKIHNTHDSEDVVQEILLSIHKASHTYDSNRDFKVWMFAIARYRLNDHLRGLYRKAAHTSDIDFEDVADLLYIDDVTKTYQHNEYLDKLLQSLPVKQRKIITMMKIEGYNVKETAQKMKMGESAVKVSAHRAYKALTLKAMEYDQ